MIKLPALVDQLTGFLQHQSAPYLFGVSGGQGAGKTTLCQALVAALESHGKTAITLSLDDFYLSKAARAHLAETVHPLCATRGVPGTHDVDLLKQTLIQLRDGHAIVPQFSKSHDDLMPADQWPVMARRPDVILLEGWCVGARAGFIDAAPQTAWEQSHDPQALWKSWTQTAVAAYGEVWDELQALLVLRQESFDAVIDSRWQQEQGNAAATGVWQFTSRQEVAAFCAHYESWTLGLWAHLTPQADFAFIRDGDFSYHRLVSD